MAEMSSSMAVRSAMDAPMSSSLGAMGPVLRKLDSLLAPDYWLPKLLKDRIQLLKADLEEISDALLEQSMVDSPSEMAKYWMNEVRELCYDIDDFVDNMMSTHADAKMRSVQSYKVGRVKIDWLPKRRKPCTRTAKVAELRTLVREASERHDRYLDGGASNSRRVFTGHGRNPALYAEAANNLVGVDDSMAKLIKWLTDKEEQQLKVVAIVGPAGVGKTTLAKQVYHELWEQFECRAFVRASRKPDMRRLLGGILSQVEGYRRPFDSCTVQNLIDNLTEHLQDKRYIIVIDDLWETTAWDIVTSAFQGGNSRSRIITTTEVEGVALECCDYRSSDILKMKPLGGEDSGKLLFNLVFGPKHLCPEPLRGASDIIITKCAGLPFATIFVAGLLTTQPYNSELWQHVQECICSTLSTNSTLEETLQEILKLSYNSLPHYLKTCLMYLSVYPEGYTLWKIDLVKQWIAEGFIHATEGADSGEVADSYFEELVNRGMIQPIDINYNGEVFSCTLHHIVLDLIALESTEERFITALDYSETIREQHSKARRLSLHFSNTRYAMKPTGLTLSKVRSICFFGILECLPTIVEFKHLRVLILEVWGDQRGSTSFNLTRICRLFQLRYLKIVCDASVEVELPTQMQMLRYLETLIIDASVSAVPLDIVDLPGLLHLSLGDKTDLPDEIGRIRSLRTLHYFDLGSNSEGNVLSLGDLMNLQDLHLTYCTEDLNENLERNLAALASSLEKLVNLKSVTLAPGASGTTIYHDVWSSMSSLPVFLQRLELLPPICIFSRLPEWIGKLRNLHILKVVVSELLMEDMDILIGLPALNILSLYVRRPTEESIIFKRGAFLGLKCFKYTCGVLSLAFQEEAFPNLQRLELSFNAHRGEEYDDLLSGIDYLLNIKEIVGRIGAAVGAEEPDRRAAESAFKDAISKHPRFPSYENVKRVDWICEEYQLRTQSKDSSGRKNEILQKECIRKEGDSSDGHFGILLKASKQETERSAYRMPHIPDNLSIIPFDQMKTGTGIEDFSWIALPTIFDLLNKCSNYLHFGTSAKLRQLGPKIVLLERAMKVFQVIPERARLEQFFVDLKCAFYEVEEMLDDVEYQCLENTIQIGASRSRRGWWSSRLENKVKFNYQGGASALKRDWLMKKVRSASICPLRRKMLKGNLKDSLEKLEEIINNACKFLEWLNLSSASYGNRSQAVHASSAVAATTSVPRQVVIGRDKECAKIIALFHDNKGAVTTDNALCYSVFGIHGIGGSGKSTLAKLVYAREKKNKEEKMDGHFELVMWVHVSQSFTVSAILEEIFEAATGDPCPLLNNLNSLHDKLEEELYGKRFLLVLDDVWCNIEDDRQRGELQQILSPLKAGRAGSKILVTSRTKDALSVLGAAEPRCIPIPDLDDDAFLDLLMHYALEGRNVDDYARISLETIGTEIAKKLKASPLAARTVGGQLGRRPNAEFWTTVKNGKFLDETMSNLWWSYHQLDQQARRCFAYCGIFPRRHRLYRDELVNLWVAEGFARSTNEGEEMEDVARGYFDELASTSFVQPGGVDYSDKEYYVVHDLLHDLAEKVSGSDCFRIENGLRLSLDLWRGKFQRGAGWRGDVPQDVRRVFVQNYDKELITEILQLKNLRTLIIYAVGKFEPVEEEVIDSICMRLPKLRVLTIALSQEHHALIKEPDVQLLPESISQLRHLRYLAFRTSTRCRLILPSALTKLYHIQLLDFGQCGKSDFSGGNLVNLRHLFMGQKVDISNIRMLTSLQTVPFFTVRDERGYEINQLRDLNKLHGTLCINGLGNVKSKAEALEANLAAKEQLTTLTLDWDDDTDCNPEVQAEVLDGLCPPVRLETLEICHYNGPRYPNWMVSKQNGGPWYLQELWFDGCSQLRSGHVLDAFVHLGSLRVWNCSWDALPGNMEHLASLKKLEIYKCLNILSLPTLPQSLQEFKLVECNVEFMESCQTAGHPNWRKIMHIPMKKCVHSLGVKLLPPRP